MRERLCAYIREYAQEYDLRHLQPNWEGVNDMLSLFREEIDKLKPLSDEEIFEIYAASGQLPHYDNCIAQAALDSVKEQLKKVME